MTRTIPGHVDSTGKLLNRLALMTGDVVTQKGKPILEPRRELLVMPSLARRFTCVSGCSACCLPFTLDFCPAEWAGLSRNLVAKQGAPNPRNLFEEREIEVNGTEHTILSYPQYKDDKCPFLQPIRDDGNPGCSFVPGQNLQPLECATAPQILNSTRGDYYATISSRPFGRGWAWKDKPQCDFEPVALTEKELEEIDMTDKIALLGRYSLWADHLGVRTVIDQVVEILSDFRSRLISNNMRSIVVELS